MEKPFASEFEKAAAAQPRGGLLSELRGFLNTNEKWWLLPLLVALLFLGCWFACPARAWRRSFIHRSGQSARLAGTGLCA
jgi:hypothetical protein